MKEEKSYFGGLFCGIKTLCVGLKTTMREFFTPKVTEQYPENRKELKMFDRYRGRLVMIHNERNEHHCVGCGLCQMACPNDTLHVQTEMVTTDDGKKKRQLVKYTYNLGSCIFCQLCVRACPHHAIAFSQEFENAVFDRSKLIVTLNHPGSKLEERPAPAAKPAAAPAAAKAAAKPAAAEPAAAKAAAKPAAEPAVAKAAAKPAAAEPAAAEPAAAEPAAEPAVAKAAAKPAAAKAAAKPAAEAESETKPESTK